VASHSEPWQPAVATGHGGEPHGEPWAQGNVVRQVRKDLVLIGAGHAHLEVLRRLARQPLPGARLTPIARERYTTHSGMPPGVIAGLYRAEAAQVALKARLARTGQRTDP
jgi:hypothetical protein